MTLARVGCVPVHRSGLGLTCVACAGGPLLGAPAGAQVPVEGRGVRRRGQHPAVAQGALADALLVHGGVGVGDGHGHVHGEVLLGQRCGLQEGGQRGEVHTHTHTHMHTNTHTEKDIEEERERERGRINNLMGLRVGEEGRRWFKGGQKCPSMLSYVCPTGELPRRLTQHVTHISRIKVGF